MKQQNMINDRIISQISDVIEKSAEPYELDIVSLVLYGSRARGDGNSQSEYEILVMVENETSTDKFIKFENSLRITLLKAKLVFVKIMTYTPDSFEDILYNDKILGTFLYMLCRDSVVLYDRHGVFTAIKERLARGEMKKEEDFLTQCIEFARMMGSEKWAQKWEKTLMQVKYLRKRREF